MIAVTAGASCQDLGVSLDELKAFALGELDWVEIESVVCGLEPGWDQAVAFTAMDLGIAIQVIVPYAGWEKKWSPGIQKRARELINYSATYTLMNAEPAHDPTAADMYMVSIGDKVLSLQKPGGRSLRVDTATRTKKEVVDLWPAWKEAGLGA